MRSIFNGSVTFGMVNIACKLYSATEDHELASHQVHAKDHGKINYKKVCADCGETVESRDIAKSFTVEDQTVVLTDDDLSQIEAGKSREISVVEFVPAGSIDPAMYSACYYLGPADTAAIKAYALLTSTLESAGRVAIVRLTMRQKTRLAALGVTGKGILVLYALRWPDEIRPAVLPALDNAVMDRKREELTDAERDMAAQLVQSMTAESFNPDRHQDSYAVELRELVMSKLGDEKAPDDVSDLLAKLEASVKPSAEPVKKVCKADIRTWARSQGIAIGNRGRVPKDIIDRFEKATA